MYLFVNKKKHISLHIKIIKYNKYVSFQKLICLFVWKTGKTAKTEGLIKNTAVLNVLNTLLNNI